MFLAIQYGKSDIVSDFSSMKSLVVFCGLLVAVASVDFQELQNEGTESPRYKVSLKHTTTWQLSGLTWPDQSNACTEYATSLSGLSGFLSGLLHPTGFD